MTCKFDEVPIFQYGIRNWLLLKLKTFNPLSPRSDQDQFSPNDIHALSRDKS